jgi:hypothetical protein
MQHPAQGAAHDPGGRERCREARADPARVAAGAAFAYAAALVNRDLGPGAPEGERAGEADDSPADDRDVHVASSR